MIGFLLGAGATMLNASEDTISSMVVARKVQGKDWIEKGELKNE